MSRFASTRAEKRASQPGPGTAQCRVGSMDEDGMRYGFTTQALIASTMATAPTIVTTQSMATRHGRGSPAVSRSTGLRDRWTGAGTVAMSTWWFDRQSASYSALRSGERRSS
jgi:hypothetical protein